MKSYYSILEVENNSSLDEIKKSYRRLSKLYHPDKNPDTEDLFKEINNAYKTLSDPEKKKDYDGQFNRLNLGHLFKKRQPQDCMYTVRVSLEELYNKKIKSFKISLFTFCEECKKVKCDYCNGAGIIVNSIRDFFNKQTCTQCKGTGLVKNCHCNYGVYKKDYTKSIQLEPNMEHGHKIFLKNEGHQNVERMKGTIIVFIEEHVHTLFKRNGKNLLMEHELSLKESLIGTSFSFLHLDNEEKVVNIKNIIEPNEKKEVQGLGMPDGNLIIWFKVVYPKSLTDEQKTAISTLF